MDQVPGAPAQLWSEIGVTEAKGTEAYALAKGRRCDVDQGDVFSRSVPAAAFEQLLGAAPVRSVPRRKTRAA